MNSEGFFTTKIMSEYEYALAEVKLYLDSMLEYYFKYKSMSFMTGWRVKGKESINGKIAKKIEKNGSTIDVLKEIKDIAGIRVVLCADDSLRKYGLGYLDYKIHSLDEKGFKKCFLSIFDKYDESYIKEIDNFISFLKDDLRYKGMIDDSDSKNYIKHPKKSGYQSRHICIYASNGYPVEIQFRDLPRHLFAEFEHHVFYKADDFSRAKYKDVCIECGGMLRKTSGNYYGRKKHAVVTCRNVKVKVKANYLKLSTI